VTRVGFIGLGSMGGRLARRLLDAGHGLVVWNRTRAKAQPLEAAGAGLAETPADVAAEAEVVLTMVTGPAALRAVVEGPDGIASAIAGPTTLIEMSTVGPAAVSRLASLLPEGVGLLDAPVLGSVSEAESGSLAIFVGGPASLVQRWVPLLSTLGRPLHVGPLGTGAASKLVANSTLFDTLGALGEAIALAQGLGLSRETTYDVLATTPLAAQAQRRREAIETGRYPPRFPLSLALKDARLIHEAADDAAIDVRLTNAAATWLAEAHAAGWGDRDYTALLAMILDGADGHPGGKAVPRPPNGSYPGRIEVDGLIVDLDGVVWRGDEPIEGAAEAIASIRGRGIRVLFLTNAPRSSRTAFASQLTTMGIPATEADVLTSASATARAVGNLDGLPSRRALVIGPPALHDEIANVGFDLVVRDDASRAALVVVGGHHGFDYAELRAATIAIHNGARLFATGRDAIFRTAEGPWPGTGAILAAIETAGGIRAVVVGKPEPIMFEIARDALAGCSHVAVVGDHLISDIQGAKRAGLAAILVLTGTTSRSDLHRAVVRPDLVLESLAALPDVVQTS
jgi:HAD superfamily hydrolase (TIGR01450 family)